MKRQRPLSLILFDFDGTLAALRRRPATVVLPVAIRQALVRLRKHPSVRMGIVSGRELADLRRRVGLSGLSYVGNHGFEILQEGRLWVHPQALSMVPLIQRVSKQLIGSLSSVSGVEIENKRLTISVHVRRVASSRVGFVQQIMKKVLRRMPEGHRLLIRPGKKVFEIRPRLLWDKGRAVMKLLCQLPQGSIALYVGDDHTDEDVFRCLSAPHVTIRVGSGEKTRALFRLPRQSAIHTLLKALNKQSGDKLE